MALAEANVSSLADTLDRSASTPVPLIVPFKTMLPGMVIVPVVPLAEPVR